LKFLRLNKDGVCATDLRMATTSLNIDSNEDNRVQHACGTHEDKGCVQDPIVLLRTLSVEHLRFLGVYGGKVGAWATHSQWFEKLIEAGMEAAARFPAVVE